MFGLQIEFTSLDIWGLHGQRKICCVQWRVRDCLVELVKNDTDMTVLELWRGDYKGAREFAVTWFLVTWNKERGEKPQDNARE